MHPEDVEQAVAQVCIYNGLRSGSRGSDGDGERRPLRAEVFADVKELEVFQLVEVRSLRFTARFPDLVELRVMCQSDLHELRGIGSCLLLEKLWVTNCGLRSLGTEIGNCARLTDIDVSGNELVRLRELDTLRNLRKLWANENRLTSLEDVGKLLALEELWLARNFIAEVGTTLDALSALRELNLAENEVRSFKEILNLSRVPALVNLRLNDPHFGSNPVCHLSNYRTYILCHLRGLRVFDGTAIDKETKLLTDATFYKKRMYYNMRIKTLKRNMTNVVRKARDTAGASESRINMSLSILLRQIKQVQRELDELKIYGPSLGTPAGADGTYAKQLENKRLALEACIAGRRAQISAIAEAQKSLAANVQRIGAKAVEYLKMELESGGNLRLVEAKPSSDSGYEWVSEFCQAAVDTSAYRSLGFAGVEPAQVMRVHNKSLKILFDQRVAQLAEASGSGEVPVEYAVFVVDKDGPASADEIAVAGFPDPASFLASTGHAAIPLRNFLDTREIRGKRTGLPSATEVNLVIAQVCPGRHASTSGARALVDAGRAVETPVPIRKRSHAQITVPPHREARKQIYDTQLWGSHDLGASDFLPDSVSATTVLPTRFPGFHALVDDPAPMSKAEFPGGAASRDDNEPRENELGSRKEYLVFDKRLILPEYVVRLRCIPNTALDARLRAVPGSEVMTSRRKLDTQHASAVDLGGDVGPLLEPLVDFLQQLPRFESMHGTTAKRCEHVVAMLPQMRPRPELSELSELVVLNWTCQPSLSQLTYLNLHGNNLREIRGLATCKSLQTLILSFNELQEIQGLETNLELTHVDLGYNAIREIGGLVALCKLRELELNNNLICRLADILSLRKQLTALCRLDLSNNAVCETPLYTGRVLDAFPLLIKLDGRAITDRDRSLEATRVIKLDKETLAQYARRIAPSITASTLNEVETLDIARVHLGDLAGIERLTSLRCISLAGNQLISVDPLGECRLLEEVNLEANRLTKLDGLRECKFLKKLDVGKNRLSRLSGLDGLVNLTQLSLEDNDIRTLAGLSQLSNLMELYIGNNKVDGLRELQQLRALPRLLILDMLGNPVSRESTYRMYVVFYMKKLKVLDGEGIARTEIAAARERYAGKLSLEFLTDQVGHQFYEQVHELDLSQSKLRDVEQGCLTGAHFPNLCTLDLSANAIASVDAIRNLQALTMLHLAQNKLTSFAEGVLASMPALRHLELGQNRISSIRDLKLSSCKELRVLRLDGNEISILDGLDGCSELRELDLSKNKFRSLESFERETPALSNLRCLHMEENGLRSLGDLKHCVKLHSLHLNSNRLLDLDELDRLTCIPFLLELTAAGNPVSRKRMYRSRVVYSMAALKFLDGKEITQDERLRTDALLSPGPESLDPAVGAFQDHSLTPMYANADAWERANGLGALTVTGKLPAKAPAFSVSGRGNFGGVGGGGGGGGGAGSGNGNSPTRRGRTLEISSGGPSASRRTSSSRISIPVSRKPVEDLNLVVNNAKQAQRQGKTTFGKPDGGAGDRIKLPRVAGDPVEAGGNARAGMTPGTGNSLVSSSPSPASSRAGSGASPGMAAERDSSQSSSGLTEFQKLFANSHKAIWQSPPDRPRAGRRAFVQAGRR